MECSKTFCCITRNNQGNCEARKGKWFPLAQTPTSIIVFSNERYPTDKDRYPHIEVESTSTEDIVWYQILGKW